MWTRGVLKEKAKAAFARSRWGLIVCCLIISFISGASSGGTSSYSRNLNTGSGSGSGSDAENYANLFQNFGNFNGLESFQNGDVPAELITGLVALFIGIMLAAIVVGILVSLFITNPLMVGCMRYMEEACYTQKKVGDLGLVAYVFKKGRYGNSIKTMFLKSLYLALWYMLVLIPDIVIIYFAITNPGQWRLFLLLGLLSILLMIPYFIKTYEYRMIPYILAENPNLESKKVFQLTREMMNGNKWDAFVLDLSFIGWHLLAILTCGILEIFYVMPYEYMTNTFLYETLKQNASYDYFDRTIGAQPTYGTAAAGAGYYQDATMNDATATYQDNEPLPVDDPNQAGGWMPVYNPDQNAAPQDDQSGDDQNTDL
ncbi:MAG: DUF975 family protein [Lachnospiraceae bacterium]|nr:DUF975 family protein [Lachnospiraceae bacterium]